MAFNVMAANCDDHSKNVAFLLPAGTRQWRLSPAFDITHAYNPKGEWTYQHLMAINGKFAGITCDDLLRVADRYAIGPVPIILTHIAEALDQWPIFARQAGLQEATIQTVAADFQRL